MMDASTWTNEDLIYHLCHTTNLYDTATQRPTPSAEERISLEADLRERRMTGAQLISNVEFFVFQQISPQTLLALVDVVKYLRSNASSGQQSTPAPVTTTLTNDHASMVEPKKKRRRISIMETTALPPLQHPVASNVGVKSQNSVRTENWNHLQHWSQSGNADEEILIPISDDEVTESDEQPDVEVVGDVQEIDEQEDEDVEEEAAANDEIIEEAGIPQEVHSHRRALSKEQVVDIINENIEFYSSRWVPGAGQDPEYITDPSILWEKAENEGRRHQLVKKQKEALEWLKSRLDAFGDMILYNPCTSVKEVERLCKTLEGTVDQIQEAEWLLGIYEVELETRTSEDGQQEATEIIDLGSESDSEASGEVIRDISPLGSWAKLARGSMKSRYNPNRDQQVHDAQLAAQVSRELHIQTQTQSAPTSNRLADNPGFSSISSVSRWNWDTLVYNKDRKRIVMKAVHEMSPEDREILRTRVNTLRKQNLLMEIPHCVNMLIRGDKKLPGQLPRDADKTIKWTKLFMSWWLADNYFKKSATEDELKGLLACLNDKDDDRDVFYMFVRHILDGTFSLEALSKPYAPSQAEVIVISDDEDTLEPSAKRKRSERTVPFVPANPIVLDW